MLMSLVLHCTIICHFKIDYWALSCCYNEHTTPNQQFAFQDNKWFGKKCSEHVCNSKYFTPVSDFRKNTNFKRQNDLIVTWNAVITCLNQKIKSQSWHYHLTSGCDPVTPCNEGYSCDTGYCYKKCQSTADCPAKAICYELFGMCYPECTKDRDCIGRQTCQEGGFCLTTIEDQKDTDSG